MNGSVIFSYLNLHGHDLRLIWSCPSRFKLSLPQCNIPVVLNGMSSRLKVGFLACIDDICVLDMKVIIIDQTPKVQAYGRKSRGTLCSLPRKLTKATPGGVEVNLADKIFFFILLISAQLIHLYCVALIF